MSQVTITDERLRAELERADGSVTVRDPDGRIMGVFTPVKPADLQPRISEEELQRREKLGGGRKLADILRDLEGRA